VRARTSPLAWTPRLIRLGIAFAVLQAAIVGIVGAVLRAPAVSAVALLVSPRVVDLACAFMVPIESRLLKPYLDRAKDRLASVRPRVVAVTGSYGKTSTKQAIAHIVSGSVSVVASPASFNNRSGLARAVNEHLAEGTDVFVAEMGTYGPGEIAELCQWIRPEVAVITAIGPVHLERFGSEERVLQAKSEIVADCDVAVLAVDDERLSALAGALAAAGRRVVRCSSKDPSADVLVERQGGTTGTVRVSVEGRVVREGIHNSARESNLACAVGVVLALGLPMDRAVARLEGLPESAHRLESITGSTGALLLDDTYNSNPAGAAVALSVLAELGAGSRRRVVVTPGMVELGRLQQAENMELARSVAAVATDLVVVGRTNRRALLQGARKSGSRNSGGQKQARQKRGVESHLELSVVQVDNREAAVDWVQANVGAGDVVLFENDLPDHYP
jgi:UDP-N-acetylmuramoyl-tripeptide--D-alanyl-D-alanine ligase